eukprot:6214727-Pleurochrysis_carterae.AAC.4
MAERLMREPGLRRRPRHLLQPPRERVLDGRRQALAPCLKWLPQIRVRVCRLRQELAQACDVSVRNTLRLLAGQKRCCPSKFAFQRRGLCSA